MAERRENGQSTAEKFATQAETGAGRTASRPGPEQGDANPDRAPIGGLGSSAVRGASGGSVPARTNPNGTSGMSGETTNDAQPGGAAAGEEDEDLGAERHGGKR